MRTLSAALKQQYGEKIYKLSLNSGCTCPNRDGTVGFGGCTFCSEGGSGEFASSAEEIEVQIEEAKERIRKKVSAKRFIAYFQSFTNTYGDPERLCALYEDALKRPEIVALSLGTRPDCLPGEILSVLRFLREKYGKEIWIELGLQTIHDRTARRINRGYCLPVFESSYRILKEQGFSVIIHIIYGLPGESREDMLDTVRYISGLDPHPDGVKLQLLHILKGTKMAEEYERDPFHILTLEEYTDLIVDSLRILPEDVVIHRMTGDGPKGLLIAPMWSGDKKRVLNTLNRAIRNAERRS